MKPPDDHAPNPGKHRLESDQIADACLIQTAPIVDHQDVAALGARQGFKDRRECKVSLALGGSRSSWFYSPVMAAPLQFWFDLASTYSYVAALRIERACASTSVPLVWKPFLLGPIFSQQLGISDSPFNANPVRGRYMWRDLERLCAKYGLSWRRPSVFPRNSVLAARVRRRDRRLGAAVRACCLLREFCRGDADRHLRGAFLRRVRRAVLRARSVGGCGGVGVTVGMLWRRRRSRGGLDWRLEQID